MLEEKIERLTAEVVKLREAIEKSGGSPAASGEKATAGKATAGKATAKKSKFTADQIKAAVIKVKDEVGQDAAQKVIKDAGAKGLAELITMTDKFDAAMAACEEALTAGEDGGDEDGDDELGGL